ncbi:MAG: hypothetical protein Q7T82_08090 [Armatimonadota bacterium]|nr:hypothetical protein [Armatimonadota bacterium]
MNEEMFGIVKGGEFHRLSPAGAGGSARLTGMGMQEARPPESAEIRLEDYENRAIMIRGHDSGGWIYSAEIIDHAGPILTAVVEKMFGGPTQAA